MNKVDQDTIVVGIDASPSSDVALSWAVNEAERSGRRLLIVAVWHWSEGMVGSPMSLVGHEDPHTAGRQLLSRALKRAQGHGVEVSTSLAEGGPAAQLTEIAKDAAMLVVGRHGYSKVRHSLVGSVSKGCLQHSRSPVVIVPAA
jgi:nucleotide-binding universal stress UspA family protein